VQTFFGFAVVTNLLVSLSMLQGCVSVINTLTGVNLYAISFLIPIGVVVYATIGGAGLGERAVFLAGWGMSETCFQIELKRDRMSAAVGGPKR
jgi:hypothetical protein